MENVDFKKHIRNKIKQWFNEGTTQMNYDEETGVWLIDKKIYDNVGFKVWFDFNKKKAIRIDATKLTDALLERLYYFLAGLRG